MAKEPKKYKLAKSAHLYAGLDLMGSKTSLSHKDAEIQMFDWGIRVVSKKTKRIIRVFASNLKGVEELPGQDEE